MPIFSELPARLPRCLLLVLALGCLTESAMAEVTISDHPTRGMKCLDGVCTSKKAKANLSVTDLANMLAAGDLTVVTDSAALDIRFEVPFSWTSSSRLQFDSYRSIVFEAPVTVAGNGSVSIVAHAGDSSGDFWFENNGHIEFWDLKSALLISNQNYKLVKTVQALAKAVAKNPYGFYALAKSYNAKKDGVYAQSPVGDIHGIFEGLGNGFSNVSVNDNVSGAAVGFFEGIYAGASVHNANVIDIAISAPNASVVGGLAGGGGDIVHSSASGFVTGAGSIGGLSGFSSGHIRYSNASVAVHSLSGSAGGLVGEIQDPDADWSIEQSFATGNVTADGANAVGGLVGNIYYGGGTIVNSYATGSVSGADGGYVGGVFGIKNYFAGETYATGHVAGGSNICSGGFAGVDGVDWAGGNNYWDIDTSGNDQATCGGPAGDVLGLTTQQFKSGLPTGFDPTIWGERPDINNGYPYLLGNPPPT